MENLSDRLVDKSVEAFIMGLEIYNKPTIKYRIEGFSFFICNAWELMLKAHIMETDGISAIFYDDDMERSISLNDAISKVYTDVKQPLRVNLEEIVTLRNKSTHYITQDHEILYVPFFQSCIFNFCEQIKKFHDINITDIIQQNFLTLSVNINILNNEQINAKYSPETAKKLIQDKFHLENIKSENTSNDLFIPLRVDFYNTKKIEDADLTYAIDKSSDETVRIIKTEIDPNQKYNLSRKNVIKGVNKQLKAKSIPFSYISGKGENTFNDHTLKLIMSYYNLYENYSYTFVTSTRYSQNLVNQIVFLIQQNPDIINQIKSTKKR